MLGICLKNSRSVGGSRSENCMLKNFGPIILDWLEVLHLRNGDQGRWYKTVQMRDQFFKGTTAFEKRVKHVQSEHNGWRSGMGRAIRCTLSILVGKLIPILPVIAKSEHNGQFEREGVVKDVYQSVSTELDDPAFQDALTNSEHWKEQIPIRYLPQLIDC